MPRRRRSPRPPLGSRACTPGPEQPPACPPLGPKQACEVLLPGDPRNEQELKAGVGGKGAVLFSFLQFSFSKATGRHEVRAGTTRQEERPRRAQALRRPSRGGARGRCTEPGRTGERPSVRASGPDVGTLRQRGSQVSQGPGRESTGKFSSDFLRELRL